MLIMLIQEVVGNDSEYMQRVENAFKQYSDTVFKLAYSRCGANYSDAQDVMGEVFLRLAKYKPDIQTEEHMKAWLLRATINCSKSMQTSAWHRHTVAMPEHIAVSMDEESSSVYNAVTELPVKLRTAIHLFYYEDYTVEEIAKTMGANPNTVKSWLRRGREKLKEKLCEEDL